METKNEEDLPLAMKIASTLISNELASVKPADESLNTLKWIDREETEEEKEANRKARIAFDAYIGNRHDEFDMSRLDEKDIEILKGKGYIKEDGSLKDGYEFYFSNDNILNMRSGRSSWMSLAGRHYYYDMEKKEIHMHSMS